MLSTKIPQQLPHLSVYNVNVDRASIEYLSGSDIWNFIYSPYCDHDSRFVHIYYFIPILFPIRMISSADEKLCIVLESS